MSFEPVVTILKKLADVCSGQIPIIVGLAALFTVLTIFKSQASKPGIVWWRNPGLVTDITYALVHGLAAPYFRLPAMVIVVALLSGIMTSEQAADFVVSGSGPLSALPFWAQVVVYLVVSDFLLYWIHRGFHGAAMWRFHAIHHSSEEVDWTTTYRFHPVNLMLQPALVYIVMLAMGISPQVIAFVLPFDIITAAWVHSNLNWTLGPLKYVIATPVFHRWHHTHPDEGGNANFAPTFSFWDWLFGTFYMPEGKQPNTFGQDDPLLPEGYFRQLIYPLKPKDGFGALSGASKSADTTAGPA
jgi:sterol desaturase/sphingolipid hydroxylase (fatty acid hydroxylase superfamily)